MSNNIIETQNLKKTYTIDGREVTILADISMSIKRGEFLVIQGTSGSGKTTLLSLLSGLDHPTSGHIVVDGTDITHHTENQLADLRNSYTGFVFQAFHLIPSLNALENVMFPAELNGDKEAREKAEVLLKRVGLLQRQSSFPEQLSGGEKQRVALCRALINDPRILFADEPTGNLDSRNSNEIIGLFHELHQEREATLVLATHSRDLAARAERVIHLHDGKLIDHMVEATL